MTDKATKRKRTVQLCLPPEVYDSLEEQAEEQLRSVSSLGAMLIQRALQTPTTEVCVKDTQASA